MCVCPWLCNRTPVHSVCRWCQALQQTPYSNMPLCPLYYQFRTKTPHFHDFIFAFDLIYSGTLKRIINLAQIFARCQLFARKRWCRARKPTNNFYGCETKVWTLAVFYWARNKTKPPKCSLSFQTLLLSVPGETFSFTWWFRIYRLALFSVHIFPCLTQICM